MADDSLSRSQDNNAQAKKARVPKGPPLCHHCHEPIEREDVSVLIARPQRVVHLVCWTPTHNQPVVL